MSDLISRQWCLDEYDRQHQGPAGNARKIIENAPSAEKTGKWTKKEYAEEVNGYLIPNYICSQCGYWSREDYDYCPNCGARMNEVKND